MGNRLSKIYTRTGDDGTTGLGDGSRVAKGALRIKAMGELDELNSAIGVVLTNELPDDLAECLLSIQHTLFDIGGELSIPEFRMVKADRVEFLEQNLDEFNRDLAALKEFILPGGTSAAAQTHVARSVCRRAERTLHMLSADEDISEISRQFVNRLSDLLFVAARYLNHCAGKSDILWEHDRTKKKFKRRKTQNRTDSAHP